MQIRPYGEAAVLVETNDPLGLRAAIAGIDGVGELVPAACTLLVRFDTARTSAALLSAAVRAAEIAPHQSAAGALIELAVRYDGADLESVAAEVGLGIDEVIARHCSAEYTVAFCGFSPGFAYLTGLDPRLHVTRLAPPRTTVPAGAVAIAGEYTGVYPRNSPGGWRILGSTDVSLWDLSRRAPALLTPGNRVRFVP